MQKRTFNEAVDYTMDQIRNMPLRRKEMFQLVGMVMALQGLHEQELAEEKEKRAGN